MSQLRGLIRLLRWLGIMVALLIAVTGVAVALFLIVLGFFADSARDPNRGRYIRSTMQLQRLTKAVESYRADCGVYPSASEGLNALVLDQALKGWKGPYVNEVPRDPWRRPYVYLLSRDSTAPEILSYGADGIPGGEFFNGDISNRNLKHTIPDSPFEVQTRRHVIGGWIGAWGLLIGSLFALRKISPIRA